MTLPSGNQLQSQGTAIMSTGGAPFRSLDTISHSVLRAFSSTSRPDTNANRRPSGDHSAPEKPLFWSPAKICRACEPSGAITHISRFLPIRVTEFAPKAPREPSRETDHASASSRSLRGGPVSAGIIQMLFLGPPVLAFAMKPEPSFSHVET